MLTALVALSAAPAFAQDATAGNDERARGVDVQYVDCSQVQNAIGNQYGNATAIGRDITAEIAQDLNISQNQVNACLGEVGQNGNDNNDDDNNNNNNDDDNNNDDNNNDDDNADVGDDEDDVLANTVPKVASLPNTGGPSLLALGAGLALVAGGTLIRFRR